MYNYLIGSAIVMGIGVGVSYYGGMFHKIHDWYVRKRDNAKLLFSLMNKMNAKMSDKETAVAFTINDTGRSASIIYERLDQQHILCIPYNRKFVVSMSQFKAELLRENNKPVNITQQPGVPYLVDAASLGGYAIRITNEEDGVSHDYSHNEIPYYGEEII